MYIHTYTTLYAGTIIKNAMDVKRYTSSSFPAMTVIFSARPLLFTSCWQWTAMLLASMAYTFLAPAWTAKKLRMPDPAPTSRTTWGGGGGNFEIDLVKL